MKPNSSLLNTSEAKWRTHISITFKINIRCYVNNQRLRFTTNPTINTIKFKLKPKTIHTQGYHRHAKTSLINTINLKHINTITYSYQLTRMPQTQHLDAPPQDCHGNISSPRHGLPQVLF